MHEMSIAQGLMDIVKQEMEKNNMKTLLKVKVRAGKINAIIPDALQLCFDILLQETPWQGAILEIETTPIKLKCPECNTIFIPDEEDFFHSIINIPCPKCGTDMGHEIVGGKELLIEYIEAE
jgi:hydrogenase nickel incorporation protein HypA/HybF